VRPFYDSPFVSDKSGVPPLINDEIPENLSTLLEGRTRDESVLIQKELIESINEFQRQISIMDPTFRESKLEIVDPYHEISINSPSTKDVPPLPGIVSRAVDRVHNFGGDGIKYLAIGGMVNNSETTPLNEWVRYLQKEYRDTSGYGMTDIQSDWDFSTLNLLTFQPLYGESSGTGDIKEDGQWLINTVGGESLDLVIVDSENLVDSLIVSLAVLKKRRTVDYNVDFVQELSFEEKLLGTTAPPVLGERKTVSVEGGTLVVKVPNTTDRRMVSMMYLVTSCFGSNHIYKPSVDRRPYSSERYLVCKNFLGYHRTGNDFVQTLRRIESGNYYFDTLQPTKFTQWLEGINNAMGQRQLKAARTMATASNDGQLIKVRGKDLSRMMLMLGILGTSGYSS
jgi:hypothetical protein